MALGIPLQQLPPTPSGDPWIITPRLHRKLAHYSELLLYSKQHHGFDCTMLNSALIAAVRTGSTEAVIAILDSCCDRHWPNSLRAAGIAATEENDVSMYQHLSAMTTDPEAIIDVNYMTSTVINLRMTVLLKAVQLHRLAMAVAVLQEGKGASWWTCAWLTRPFDSAVQHDRSNMVAALLCSSYTGVVWTANQLQPYIETAIRTKRSKGVLQELLAAADGGFTMADLAAPLSLALRLCNLEALEVLLAVRNTADTVNSVAAAVKPLMLKALAREHSSVLIPKLLALAPGVWGQGEVMVIEAVSADSWEGLEQQLGSEAGRAVEWEAGEITGMLDLLVALGDAAAKHKRQQLRKYRLKSSRFARGVEGPVAQENAFVLEPVPAAYWASLQCLLSMSQCSRGPEQLLGVLKVAAGVGGRGVLSQLLLESVQQEGVVAAVAWKVQQLQEATDAAAKGEGWGAMAQLLLARRVGWEVEELRNAAELLGDWPGVAQVVSLLLQLSAESHQDQVQQIAAALKAIHASVHPGPMQAAAVVCSEPSACALEERQRQGLWHCIYGLLGAGVGHWGPKQLQGLLYDAAAGGRLSVVKQLLSSWEGWEGELMQEALTAAAHRRDGRMMQLLLEGAGPAGWTTQQLQKALMAAVTGGTALVQQLLGAPGILEWDSGSLGVAVTAAAKHGCWGVLRCLVVVQGVVWGEEQLRGGGWAEEYGQAGMVQLLQGLYRPPES